MPSVRAALRTIRWSLQRRGALGTVCEILRYIRHPLIRDDADPGFDAQHGTDTAGIIIPAEMDVPSANLRFGTRYEATSSSLFSTMMEAVPEGASGSVFVDLGCGKGRTLLLASEYPFRRIVGVEYSAKLCRVAEINISRYSSPRQRCKQFSVVCCDATEYSFPTEPLVIFMYNPFREQVMARVLGNLEASLGAYPRDAFIIYHRPVLDELLSGSSSLVARSAADAFCVYHLRAPHPAAPPTAGRTPPAESGGSPAPVPQV